MPLALLSYFIQKAQQLWTGSCICSSSDQWLSKGSSDKPVFLCRTSLSQETWPHALPITVLLQIENPCISLHLILSSLIPALEDLLGHIRLILCLLDITWPWEPDFAVHPFFFFVMHGTVLSEIWPQTDDPVFVDKEQGASID